MALFVILMLAITIITLTASRNISARRRIALILISSVFIFLGISDYFSVDNCLDSGGTWDSSNNLCIKEPTTKP